MSNCTISVTLKWYEVLRPETLDCGELCDFHNDFRLCLNEGWYLGENCGWFAMWHRVATKHWCICTLRGWAGLGGFSETVSLLYDCCCCLGGFGSRSGEWVCLLCCLLCAQCHLLCISFCGFYVTLDDCRSLHDTSEVRSVFSIDQVKPSILKQYFLHWQIVARVRLD